MARARTLFPFLAVALAWAAPAAAQHITSPYRYLDERQYVTVFGGHLNTGTGAVALGPTAGSIFGAMYGYRINGPFTTEIMLGYAPLTRVVRDTTHPAGDTLSWTPVGSPVPQRVLVGMVSLRVDLTGPRTWYNLQPYVLLGGGGAVGLSSQTGAALTVPSDVRFSFGTSFAAQAGGGIEWYATRRIGLRVDGRGNIWKLRTPVAFANREPLLGTGDWTQNVSLVGGLSVHF